MQRLTKRSSQLKGEIIDHIRQQYIDFDSYVDTTVALEQQVRDVLKEYKRLSTRMEQELRGRVSRTVEERPDIEAKLKETQEQINLVQNLVSVYLGIETARKDMAPENYISCGEHLHNAAEGLQVLGSQGCEAKVYRALKSELADVMSDLSLRLREEWRKFVQWKPQTLPDSPKLETLLTVELRISSVTGSPGASLDDVVKTMKLLSATSVWREKVKMFGQKLLVMFVRPLITNKGISLLLSKEDTAQILKLTATNKHTITDLYHDLTTLVTTVRQIVSQGYREEWMLELGRVVCSDMCELIIAHRLSTAIPRDSHELAKYGELSSQTQQFEKSLVDLGLLKQESCGKLSEYTKEVNSHFATQKSQDLLSRAREILMKPSHDTMMVIQDTSLERLADLGEGSSPKEGPSKQVGELANLNFRFPKCAISKSVQEFIDLLYETLKDCCNSPLSMSLQLFSTSRNMVDLFCAILRSYHRQTIAELPRVAIVQHNNCLYLAHHLMTLGHQFHSRLPPPLNSEVATFVDLVPLVRQLGEELYIGEMKKQASILTDALKSCGGLDNVSEDIRSKAVRKGIQQAQLHVVKLSQVYAEVLPEEIHQRTVGALLNVIASELVRSVLALEDIAMDDATELHAVLNLVVEKGPLVLDTGDEETQARLLETHCKDWSKLRELAVVMDASLQKIVEMWGSGKGKLAQAFTPMEIRGLIKALFKNTERRAAALAKITL